ncbi:hypothetical protein LCGC14_0174450 [marine sediment metagenome]|uniref:Uncharacterized protein n=1 Tax=marine sediment metagenome TaxID=412755 RepID=A0A0F9X9C4_9ZZZZ
MARAKYVNKARKDYSESNIQKGDSYWWWKKWKKPIQRSKTKPTRSQLTNSPFLAQIYTIEDAMRETTDVDAIDGFITEFQEMLDEQEEALDNMPEQLQDDSFPANRIESLEEVIETLENIDTDMATADILEDIQNISYNGD